VSLDALKITWEYHYFKIIENKIVCLNDFFSSISERAFCIIKKLPEKTPLFTTEDGVEIFENDKYYFINNGFMCVKSFAENLGLLISAKTFHSKPKAEEYILLNKPCLSLNDLLKKFYPKDYDFKKRHNNGAMEDIHTNDLIELAKSKL